MSSLNDRIEGVLLGTAAGDALGAPYEFQPPRGPELPVEMVGGGPWAPGEWTDDTAMAIAIAEVAARGVDLRDATAQDAIVTRWREWSLDAKDVGIQTRSVLREAARGGEITAARARAAAATLHEHTGRTAGNGSLMRTAPIALVYLDDEDALVAAARAISELTHFDPDAADATVLWSCAIRHAVLTTELDVRIGLRHLDVARQDVWSERIEQAEGCRPSDFANNGWVVAALQAAWSAIATTTTAPGTHRAEHLRRGLDAAVRAGDDTDTVAAIAGGLLGAAYGASAVPLEWRYLLHGWPGITGRGLVQLATAIHRKGRPVRQPTYPGSRVSTLAPHPYDPQVLLGGVGVLAELPAEVDAVVSLCRVAEADVPSGMPHVEVRLIDRIDSDENPHLDFVLLDTVRAIEVLRAQGRTVLVHCAEAYSRTPTVAALYGARLREVGADEALHDVLAALPDANPNSAFRDALRRLGESVQPTATDRPDASDQGTDRELTWRGVLDPHQLVNHVVATAHRLADAAKAGDWPAVFRILDDPDLEADIAWWRPGGSAWFTVLHQAAWHGVSADIAEGLVARGALRSQTDARGRTAYDVCLEKNSADTPSSDALFNALRPPPSPLAPHRIRALDRHLATVIDGRIRGLLYDGRDPGEVLRYPSAGILHELPDQNLWFPVPGMYGGFSIALRDAELYVESWCRVVGGSGQAHLITHHGATLVDQGFV